MGDLFKQQVPEKDPELQAAEDRAKADRIDQIQTGVQRQTGQLFRLFGRRGGFSGLNSRPPIQG